MKTLLALCSVTATLAVAGAEPYRIPYTNNSQGVVAEYSSKFQAWSLRWPSASGKTLAVQVPEGKTITEVADCKGVAKFLKIAKGNEAIQSHIRGKLLIDNKSVKTKWTISDFKPSDPVFLANAKRLLQQTGYPGEGLILEPGSVAYRLQDPVLKFTWAEDAYSKVLGTEEIEKAYRAKVDEFALTDSVESEPMGIAIPEKDFFCDLVEGKVEITYSNNVKQALMTAVNPKLTERDVLQMHDLLLDEARVASRSTDEQRFVWGYRTQSSLVEVLRQGSLKINDEDFVRLFTLFFFEQNGSLVFQGKDAVRVNFRKYNFADVAEGLVETPIKVVFGRDAIVAESVVSDE